MDATAFHSATIDSSSETPRSNVAARLMPKHRPLSLTKRIVFSLIPVGTLFVFAELVARLIATGPSGAHRFEQIEQIIVYLGNKPGESIFEPDPDCFWRLKPNVTLPADRGAAWGGMMSNSHGHRSREVALADAEQRTRVLCFGDSSTFAFGVDFADAWPNQLQELLDEERPGEVEVLNAGIPGQTTYQGRQRLNRELTKWRPHLAVITFGNNDGWRWDDRADKDHVAKSSRSDSLTILNQSRAWQCLTSYRHQFAQAQATRDQLKWAQQASWNYFDPNNKWTPRVSLDDFAENLRAMIAQCQQHNCQPVLVVWPDQRQLLGQPTWRPPYQEAMRNVAKDAGVKCLDLVPLFEQAEEWAIERFIPNDVVHLDRAGNRFVADVVAKLVREATPPSVSPTQP